VRYDHDGTACEGYLAWKPAYTHKPRPAVMLVHDWMGVGPNIRARAVMAARLGYVAFAPDVYGAGVRPRNAQDASAQAAGFYADLDLFRGRLQAGLDWLSAQPGVHGAKIAAAGYCFGGTGVLELARSGADLCGVAPIHGRLLSHDPSDADRIRAAVLILAGGDDPVCPDQDVLAVVNELRDAGVDWELDMYGGAPHAYTIAGAPSFRAEADRRTWLSLTDFLSRVL
jgi:dienelactone hydrolase